MPKAHDDLKSCLRDAGRDPAKKADCERKFKGDGGTVDGGKVFETPDGNVTVVTNGGKVFSFKA